MSRSLKDQFFYHKASEENNFSLNPSHKSKDVSKDMPGAGGVPVGMMEYIGKVFRPSHICTDHPTYLFAMPYWAENRGFWQLAGRMSVDDC